MSFTQWAGIAMMALQVADLALYYFNVGDLPKKDWVGVFIWTSISIYMIFNAPWS